jgi:hypothetical protein
MTCYAVEFGYGPINWRCNKPANHDGPHASSQFGQDVYEWADE